MSYDPTWVEVLRAAVSEGLATVHTSMPGKVLSYDPATQTVTVQPMLHWEEDPIPPLEGVKVRFPRFGNFRLVGPIVAGQEVTLEFAELDPSRWEATGEISKPEILSRHGLFATAIPGAFSDANALADAPTDALRIGKADGTIDIVIEDGVIKLGDDTATEFVALAGLVADELERIKAELIALQAATLAVAVVTDALTPGTSAAFSAATLNVGADPGDVAATKVKAK